tara:strand:- start:6 stop:773 length:768 start_codon:yes stop_codon:yes gene_type:complete
MEQAIQGYNRAIFHYIKDIVDYSEKSNKGLPNDSVVTGFTVITNIFMLSLSYYKDIARCSQLTGDAIPVFIDFIVQMNNLSNTINPTSNIGLKDAAMFVYKKVMPKERFFAKEADNSMNMDMTSHNKIIIRSHSQDDQLSKMPANMQLIPINDISIVLSQMHYYTMIIRNMITVLFSKNVFYDKQSDTIEYYSQLITNMIHLIVLIEQNSSKINTIKMKSILSEQNKYGCPVKLDTTEATIYVSWLENIINDVLR